ncbi:hypothetical protein AB3S75_019307 [Citrus x aurantiifolia]
MGKGAGSLGKRKNKTHTLWVRCGRRSFHLQKSRCSSCGFPSSRINVYNASIVDLLQFVFLIFLDNEITGEHEGNSEKDYWDRE